MTTPPDRVRVVAVFAAGLAVCLVPDVLAQPVRNGIRDMIIPARSWVVARGREWMASESPANPAPYGISQREQALELEVARLHRRDTALLRTGSDPESLAGKPLILAEGIPAKILGDFAARFWRTRGALTAGSAAGVPESAIVIDSSAPLLDVGRIAGVEPSDLVRTGSAVVGLVGETGRWSSLLRPITDREFRAGARLARRVNDTFVFAADGVIQGDGEEGCTLRMIPPTEPVQVGDLVVTVERDTGSNQPFVFGVVEQADLPDNALEWSIQVRPAVKWNSTSTVSVIRLSVNRERLLAN